MWPTPALNCQREGRWVKDSFACLRSFDIWLFFIHYNRDEIDESEMLEIFHNFVDENFWININLIRCLLWSHFIGLRELYSDNKLFFMWSKIPGFKVITLNDLHSNRSFKKKHFFCQIFLLPFNFFHWQTSYLWIHLMMNFL